MAQSEFARPLRSLNVAGEVRRVLRNGVGPVLGQVDALRTQDHRPSPPHKQVRLTGMRTLILRATGASLLHTGKECSNPMRGMIHTMTIRICVAGATGWAGSAIAREILASPDLTLSGAVARSQAGADVGTALGLAETGITIRPSIDDALQNPTDVLIDYTAPDTVKGHALKALEHGVRVVVGTSGLTAADYADIDRAAAGRHLGVVAAGNFSITAALAKRFALMAAAHLPSFEIIDYASAGKIDAPSGTVQELAEELSQVRRPQIEVPVEKTFGSPATRGASISGTQVHALRLPSYVIAFETIFGLPDERLTIRHDAGAGAKPYVAGTLLAARKVMTVQGLVRGLDRLLFDL